MRHQTGQADALARSCCRRRRRRGAAAARRRSAASGRSGRAWHTRGSACGQRRDAVPAARTCPRTRRRSSSRRGRVAGRTAVPSMSGRNWAGSTAFGLTRIFVGRHARRQHIVAQDPRDDDHAVGGAQVDPFDQRRRARQVQPAPVAALPHLRAVELEHQRHAQHARQQRARAVERGVALVDRARAGRARGFAARRRRRRRCRPGPRPRAAGRRTTSRARRRRSARRRPASGRRRPPAPRRRPARARRSRPRCGRPSRRPRGPARAGCADTAMRLGRRRRTAARPDQRARCTRSSGSPSTSASPHASRWRTIGHQIARQMGAETERLAVAAQVDPPARLGARQAEDQARQPQARLAQVGRDQDRRVVALAPEPTQTVASGRRRSRLDRANASVVPTAELALRPPPSTSARDASPSGMTTSAWLPCALERLRDRPRCVASIARGPGKVALDGLRARRRRSPGAGAHLSSSASSRVGQRRRRRRAAPGSRCWPSSIVPSSPPTAVATTGSPHAIASSATMPCASELDGRANTSAAA